MTIFVRQNGAAAASIVTPNSNSLQVSTLSSSLTCTLDAVPSEESFNLCIEILTADVSVCA